MPKQKQFTLCAVKFTHYLYLLLYLDTHQVLWTGELLNQVSSLYC